MLRSRQLFNHIRRYNHSHSPSHKQIDVKMDKIMLNLNEIEIHVKGIYYVSVITGLILMFK